MSTFIPTWEASVPSRISSDVDFPFEFSFDLPIVSVKLHATYKLPNINNFHATDVSIDGGIVNICHLPMHSVNIYIDEAHVLDSGIILSYPDCEYISMSNCKISPFNIEKFFPNAKVVLSECHQVEFEYISKWKWQID